ncbi:MAG: hypothetical protein WBO44_06940 [Saprospiraceae bacterium]
MKIFSNYIFGLILLITFWISGCKNELPEGVRKLISKDKEEVIVVLCDVTKSLDSVEFIKTLENSKKIMILKPLAHIYYYHLGDNAYPSILKYKQPYIKLKKSEIDEMMENDPLDFEVKLIEAYNNHSANSSCLSQGFEISRKKFMEFKPETDYSFRIVFLSDFLENCKYDFGILNLENSDLLISSFENLSKFQPGYNLKEMNIKITLVVNTNHIFRIDPARHKSFWKEMMKKYGYSDLDFDDMNFSGDLPKNL